MSSPPNRRTGRPTRRYNSTRRALQAAQTRGDVLAAAIRAVHRSRLGRHDGRRHRRRGRRRGRDRLQRLRLEEGPAAGGDGRRRRRRRRAGPVRRARGLRRLGRGRSRAAACAPGSRCWPTSTSARPACGERSSRRRPATPRSTLAARSWRRAGGSTSGAASPRSPGPSRDEPLVDVVWVLFGPEVYLKLTVDAGRSRADYEAYASESFTRLLGIAATSITRSRTG